MARTGEAAVLLVAGALLLCGCAGAAGRGPQSPPETEIVGAWELVEGSTHGSPLPQPADRRATLTVEATRLGGTSFCNSYSTDYRHDGDGLVLGTLGGTEMGCEPEVMAAEQAYLEALGVVDTAAVHDGELLLTGGDAVLRFRALAPVPVSDLVGTRWVLDTLVQDDTASSVSGEPAVLVLAPDGTVEATTGCRRLTGEWVTHGDQVLLPSSAMDGECPADLAVQDSHVTAALGDGFRAEVSGDRLTVTGRDGHGLIYRAEP